VAKTFDPILSCRFLVADLPVGSPSELTATLLEAEKLGVSTVSDWHPNGRWLENREVVDGLFFLWSEQSSFYSGQDLISDGGMINQYVPPATPGQHMGPRLRRWVKRPRPRRLLRGSKTSEASCIPTEHAVYGPRNG
jgi:hypothetical protein